jgi:hypothetical protein
MLFARAAAMAVWSAVLALALGAATSHAQTEEVRLRVVTHGAVQSEAEATHPVDAGHFCSASPSPWVTPAQVDTRGPPFPFYRLVFGQDSPGDVPASPGPSIGLALSNYSGAARTHSDPTNDSIELVIEGRHFVGHTGLADDTKDDAGYRLAVTFREDRQGGGFVARHLLETGPAAEADPLDVEGSWTCPPVAADLPALAIREHTLFAGAVPVRPPPVALRLTHSFIPCIDRGCAAWRITEEESGAAYLARVDFRQLHLSRGLRRLAEKGVVNLLVSADIRPGLPPLVVPRILAGVAPRESEPVDDSQPGAIPEAMLR